MKRKETIFRAPPSSLAPIWRKLEFHRIFNRTRSFVLLIVCFFLTSACDETPCTFNPQTLIGIEFCDGAVSGIVSKAYPIRAIRIRNSSFFQDTVSKSMSSFKIRFPSNSDAFWLSFVDSTSKDSIRFSYSKALKFAGESCGFYYGFNDLKVDSVAGMNFERAQILSNQGDSSNKVHVRIFW